MRDISGSMNNERDRERMCIVKLLGISGRDK